MFKKLSSYLNDQKRWNEIGHSMFSFIMGTLHPAILVLYIIFVFVNELFIDGHWNFFRETEDERLDFLFDLQSKLIPALFSYYLFQNIYYLNISLIDSIVCFVVIFFFGYKGSWFYSKKK